MSDKPPRGSFGLLRDPVFGRYFAGRLLSTAGIWIHNIVAAIIAYQLTGSAFVVGLVSVAQFAPQLLLAPLSGALADRGDRRRQIVLGRIVVACGSGGLAVWLALVGVEGLPGAWPVIAAALIVGIGFVIGGPAMHALLPALVRRGELANAVALSNIPFTLGRAGGPAAGAFVAVTAGPATAFAIAAATNLLFAYLMVRLPISARAAPVADADSSVWGGLRQLRADPTLITLLIAVTAVGVGADPAVTLAPPLSANLGRGAELTGVFASAFGIGAGLAFMLLSPLRAQLGLAALSTLGLSLMAAGMYALAAGGTALLLILAFGVAGAGMTFALTSLSTQMQERLPDAVRGRVMALWSMAFLGSRPFAAGFNGAITDLVSVEAALVTVATLVLVAAWLSRPSRVGRPPGNELSKSRGVP